jgi:xanthosine utilization system XapX-like protein
MDEHICSRDRHDTIQVEQPAAPTVSILGRKITMPRSRILRVTIGVALAILGLFGFLPILGFWMVPLGLLILSYDIVAVRRLRRKTAVWWHRRRGR